MTLGTRKCIRLSFLSIKFKDEVDFFCLNDLIVDQNDWVAADSQMQFSIILRNTLFASILYGVDKSIGVTFPLW